MIKILCKKLTTELTPDAIFTAVFHDQTNRVWLDSSSYAQEGSDSRKRFSIMADDSGEDAYVHDFDTNQVWEYLNKQLPTHQVFTPAKGYECTFELGWIGWITYEQKARLLHTDRALVLDHETGECFVLFFNTQENTKWFMHVAQKISAGQVPSHSEPTTPPRFSARDTKAEYLTKVEKVQQEISEGNTYEGCLTTQLNARTPEGFNALETYLKLRNKNMAPYNSFMQLDGTSVMSTSPERFIGVSPEGTAIVEPIKGTRKRSQDPEKDREIVEGLYSSVKDRAENMMIVDLMRNDLSRSAVPGSVKVDRLFAIETYQTVHQMVSTVSAQLRDDANIGQVLQEAFPPGSMTGAPKIETMRILSALEGEPRGIYSGCLGFISNDGAVQLSVIIRTLIEHDGTLSLGVGGAIVADSIPEEEYAEIQTKANGILGVLGSDFPEE